MKIWKKNQEILNKILREFIWLINHYYKMSCRFFFLKVQMDYMIFSDENRLFDFPWRRKKRERERGRRYDGGQKVVILRNGWVCYWHFELFVKFSSTPHAIEKLCFGKTTCTLAASSNRGRMTNWLFITWLYFLYQTLIHSKMLENNNNFMQQPQTEP